MTTDEFFKLLQILHDKKIHLVFYYNPKSTYYNLKIKTPQGEDKYIANTDFNYIKEGLQVVWGHLLDGYKTKDLTTLPGEPFGSIPEPMPMPGGFPIPGVKQ